MKYDIDTETQLNEGECATLTRAVGKMVKSIFDREKDPVKRRVLTNQISGYAAYYTALSILELQTTKGPKKPT